MAIYHFSAKMISRANGSSALAAAAYRSASRLHDQRLDRQHDFSNKAGVVHSEVLLPEGAPEQWRERERLWNDVEAAELRKDAQLAREVEFALPRELDQAEGVRLAREFVQREFVDRGMVADLNVHWDIGVDGLTKPHAHVMLTTRSIGDDGFAAKNRDWNRTELLEHWRSAWAEHVNARMAELDIDASVDHRSLEAQGLSLEPQHKIGPAGSRRLERGEDAERAADHLRIARENGARIIAEPNVALDAITRTQATFTARDIARFAHRHSDGKEQFDQVSASIRNALELVQLGRDGRGEQRFTNREMLATEQRLESATVRLEASRRHTVSNDARDRALARAAARKLILSAEQRGALEQVTGARGISTVIGYAGTGKSAMLGVAREAWELDGYSVRGAALSGIAAENLEHGSGIASRTLASLEHQWKQDRELLTSRDVLLIDEAGMIGTRQLERVVSEAEKRGAKVVLVGDPEQLQAIEAGAAFRSVAERHGAYELTGVRRQHEQWQREATRWLATDRTAEAIAAYERAGLVIAARTRDGACADLVVRWGRERQISPEASRIILTHTNGEVRALNDAARNLLRSRGELGHDVAVQAGRGERVFAAGDRVMFLKNERSLGVKNGSLGTVDHVSRARMAVLLDDGRRVAFDLKDYSQFDHGYAATIHKAQGMTVDRVHVLATPGMDRHATYVALSRHRDGVELHYGQDDFADQSRLARALSRERGKDMASDYTRDLGDRRTVTTPTTTPERANAAPARDPLSSLDLRPTTPTRAPAPMIPEPARPSVDLAAAVQRHGTIVKTRAFYNSVGEAATPEQRRELAASRAALNAIYPLGARDLETAMTVDNRLISEAAAGRTAAVIRAMQLEAEMRDSPSLRADVFVQRWQGLERQRRLLMRDHEDTRAGRVADTMIGMAKGLERDPQVESLLRTRKVQLDLPDAPSRSVGQALADMIGRDRSRSLGVGM